MSAKYNEGDACPYIECPGVLEFQTPDECSCHISPPCSWCIEAGLVCNYCGWRIDDGEPQDHVEVAGEKT